MMLIIQELIDMFRGKEGPVEEMFGNRADVTDGPESQYYRDLALLHRRITSILRIGLCITIALIFLALGSMMQGVGFLIERFG